MERYGIAGLRGRLAVLLALFGVLFLLPTRSLQFIVAPSAQWISLAQGIIVVASMILLLLPAHGATRPESRASASPIWVPAPLLGLTLILLPAVFLLGIGVVHLNVPFGWDELDFVSLYLDRLGSTGINHQVSQFLAVRGMNLWGIYPWAARLPTLCFALGIVVTGAWLARRTKAYVTVAVLFLHLCFSGMACWYLHSFRGYSGMLFACFLMFSLLWDAANREDLTASWGRVLLFYAAFAVGIFSHTFTGLFFAPLWIGCALWWHEEKATLSDGQRRFFRKWFAVTWLALPAVLYKMSDQAIRLSTKKVVGEWGWNVVSPSMLNLFHSLGFAFTWQAKVALLFSLALFLYGRFQPAKRWTFLDYFAPLSFVLVTTVPAVIGSENRVFGRFFFAFLIPVLFWWVKAVGELPVGWWRRSACAALAVLAFALPWQSRATMHTFESLDVSHIEDFLRQVGKDEGEVTRGCYRCVGHPVQCTWARVFLEKRRGQQTRTPYCTQRFLMVLSRDGEPVPALPTRESATPYLRYALGGRYFWYGSTPRSGAQ